MKYFVRNGNYVYLKSDFELTKNPAEALTCKTAGEAMKMAIGINNTIGSHNFKIYSSCL